MFWMIAFLYLACGMVMVAIFAFGLSKEKTAVNQDETASFMLKAALLIELGWPLILGYVAWLFFRDLCKAAWRLAKAINRSKCA